MPFAGIMLLLCCECLNILTLMAAMCRGVSPRIFRRITRVRFEEGAVEGYLHAHVWLPAWMKQLHVIYDIHVHCKRIHTKPRTSWACT